MKSTTSSAVTSKSSKNTALTEPAATATGHANQTPAVKKHIQKERLTQPATTATGHANQTPSVKKHIQQTR